MKSAPSLSFFPIVLLVGILLFNPGCGQAEGPADLVVLGKVVTMDPTIPQAEAVAVRDGRILSVGSREDMDRYTDSSTRVIDASGSLVVPGLIEGHGHFMGLGEAKMGLDLMKAGSWSEIVSMVADAARRARPGEWIRGRGWHQEKWSSVPRPNVEGFPLHEDLSKAAPNNPVLLRHASGHASMANAKAMQMANITASTPDPEGGEILRDRNGQPIGVFRERAQGLFNNALQAFLDNRTPEEVDADDRKAVLFASREALSKGITSFQDAGSSFETVDFLQKLAVERSLDVRLWVMIRETPENLRQKFPSYRMVDYGEGFLTVRAIKWSIDGALGSRGAWLLEPYSDVPNSTGLNTASPDSIMASGEIAFAHDLQLCVHAIGDRANRETLDIFEALFKKYPGARELRWRVEHAQHLHPDDIPRFAELGVVPAMQGIHCTSDAPYVVARLGAKRAEEGAYVWQKLLKSGVRIVNGTDTPVEDINPIASFHASVSRKLKDNSVFYPDQRMSREEALRSYTLDAAYGAREEETKGSLTKGKYGDITILSKDIMTIPEDEIPSTDVLYTIVGGTVRYSKGKGFAE